MTKKKNSNKRLFVLDTNVLMHDPISLFQFKEHDIYLPMVVLEELDHWKKGVSEIARNVRQTSRFLDKLMAGVSHEQIDRGLPLSAITHVETKSPPQGQLFFQTQDLVLSSLSLKNMPSNKADNNILEVTFALQKHYPEKEVVLVSKDINLRIKAGILGIVAEDYYSDRVLEDLTQLHTGIH